MKKRFGVLTVAVVGIYAAVAATGALEEATGEIGELSRSSVDVAEKAGEMINGITPDIRKTAELVQEISASSKEQCSGADQINKPTSEFLTFTLAEEQYAVDVVQVREVLSEMRFTVIPRMPEYTRRVDSSDN